MSLQYIIDGYNIIRHQSFSHLSRIKDPRQALLDFIRFKKPCGSLKNKVTVVFDGYPQAQHAMKDDGYIKVIFSGSSTADERIKSLLERAVNLKSTVVISDDKEIGLFTRAQEANWMKVEEFLSSKSGSGNIKEKDFNKPSLSYSEIDAINRELQRKWLK